MRSVELIGTVGGENQHSERWCSMRQVMQKLERSLIRPVHVLEHEQHWLVSGESLENREDQLEGPFAFALYRRLCGAAFELREYWRQHGTQGPEHLCYSFAFSLLDPKAKCVHQGSIGH